MRQLTVRAVNKLGHDLVRRATCVSTKDFFGICDVTSKDIAGCFSDPNQLSLEERSIKYQALSVSRTKKGNEETKKNLMFGKMRVDVENVPRTHGQFDPTREVPAYGTAEIKRMFMSEETNQVEKSEHAETQSDQNSQTKEQEEEKEEEQPMLGNPAYKISEVKPVKDISEILNLFKVEDALRVSSRYSNMPPLVFEFEASPEEISHVTGYYASLRRSRQLNESFSTKKAHKESPIEETQEDSKEQDEEPKKGSLEFRPQFLDDLEAKHGGDELTQNQLESMIDECNDELNLAFQDNKFDPSIDAQYDPKNSVTTSFKALDYLKQVRASKVQPVAAKLKARLESTDRPYPLKPQVKLDSKGFRDYTTQVPDWRAMRHVDIVQHIRNNIIYNNYDILAVNKPYGIASHDQEKNREPIDMNSLVSELAKSMKIEKVFLAHRLDKFTTGVLVFATSPERASQLNKLFKNDSIKKTYWCITKGVPDPEAAIIDIPLAEFSTAGKVRSVPAPDNVPEEFQLSKTYRDARRAVTEYQVISATKDAALVEIRPRSGVKHQIRCHLSFGMDTPILGDHKYSHFGSLSPQKLPPSMLKSLNLRQPKVRTLPMHLHAKSIVIPGAKANGETLFITAPLPRHFLENAKSLKLRSGDIC